MDLIVLGHILCTLMYDNISALLFSPPFLLFPSLPLSLFPTLPLLLLTSLRRDGKRWANASVAQQSFFFAIHQQPYTFLETSGCGDSKNHSGKIRLVPSLMWKFSNYFFCETHCNLAKMSIQRRHILFWLFEQIWMFLVSIRRWNGLVTN